MKHQRTKSVFIATALLLATACKKEEPVSTSTPNVFKFTGSINSVAYDLEAGTNDYYMFTSYQQDANNVYNFRGELGPYSCTSCGKRLRITINDFDPTTVGGYAQINSSLAPGFFSYAYPGGAPTAFNVQFHSGSTNGNPSSIDWDFGDGSYDYTSTDPVHTYARPGKYLVTYRGHFSTWTCVSSYHVSVGIPDVRCTAGFGTSATGNNVMLTTSASGVGTLTYNWDFGDGNTAVTNTANYQHMYANAGVYAVTLVVRDAVGHEADFVRHCATQYWTGGYCDCYPTPATTNSNPYYLSNVVIEWFDASGVSYTSNNPHQSIESYFKLTSNDAYDDNASGQTTRKLHLNFKCMLYSTSDSVSLENGDATIAVAYH